MVRVGEATCKGAKDGLLNRWCLSKGTTLRRFSHRTVEKAIAWCPHQSNQLASGEGVDKRCIKLLDVDSGTCLKSVETGSHVLELLWNK
jgi:cell division cycle 20, cofactor of APC complex